MTMTSLIPRRSSLLLFSSFAASFAAAAFARGLTRSRFHHVPVFSSFFFLFLKDLFRGVEAVRQIAIDLKLPGVFGPLIELFTCKAEFHQAVEITAGNSLFHVVVDSDATASTVIHELNRRKAGRVTFVPLNRIEPKRPDYPASPDAMPMIKQLQFEPKFEKAFMQVFGQSRAAAVRHGE